MKKQMFEITKLKVNPKNPRIIKDEKFKKLCKSIQDFPEMMSLRPIIYDENKIILGGNMRYRALQHLGMKEVSADWVKSASELTEEQKKEFVIKDNNSFGEYDFDLLANEWSDLPLEEWGVDLENNDLPNLTDISEQIENKFEVVIECKDEAEQQYYYEKFKIENIPCRLLTL